MKLAAREGPKQKVVLPVDCLIATSYLGPIVIFCVSPVSKILQQKCCLSHAEKIPRKLIWVTKGVK
jgi:hypothetical protein